jgi:hypothetical protein
LCVTHHNAKKNRATEPFGQCPHLGQGLYLGPLANHNNKNEFKPMPQPPAVSDTVLLSQAKPSQAKPSQAKPSQAKPSQAKL